MTYDTLIIGAGLSGLAAGIRLAHFEKQVCLLERHTTIGGLNSFYRLRGRDYDVGLHAVTNYAVPGTKIGPLAKLLRQLRLSWDDFDLRPQCGSAIDFPGCRLRFTNDFEFFQRQIVEHFPRQADNFRRLLARIDGHDPLALDRRPLSARAVLDAYLSDPLLIEMLLCPLLFYGSATAGDMDFNQFVIMFDAIYRQGFGRPREGVRRILRTLVRKYKSLGGELRLRAGVRLIRIANGRAVGVELDDGTRLEARTILSSAGSYETMTLCHVGRAASVPTGDRRWTERSEGSPTATGQISFVETVVTLDRQPADLGFRDTIVFYNNSQRFRYEPPEDPIDVRSGIICSPNNFDYDEPLEDGTIRITALARPASWTDVPRARYDALKARSHEQIVAAAVEHVPDFRPHAIDADTFTPRTIRHFTGHANGAVYGAPQKILDGRTPVQNLYLCGTDQGFLGIVGAMLSGITIANLHLLR